METGYVLVLAMMAMGFGIAYAIGPSKKERFEMKWLGKRIQCYNDGGGTHNEPYSIMCIVIGVIDEDLFIISDRGTPNYVVKDSSGSQSYWKMTPAFTEDDQAILDSYGK